MTRATLIAALAAAFAAGAAHAQDSSGQSSGGGGEQAGQSQEQDQSQDQAQSGDSQGGEPQQDVITAEMLGEANVVSLEGEYNEGVWQDEAPLGTMLADLTEIGDVEDVILTARGDVQGVTADVGGFLGIGSKTVLIPLDDIRLARPDPQADELTVVTRLNEQQLNDLPEFQIAD